MPKPEVLLAPGALTGESPLWDSMRGGVWWVDIPRGEVHLLDPSTGRDQRWKVGQPVGCLALASGGRLLLALRAGLAISNPEMGDVSVLWPLPGEPDSNRPNDGRVDSYGRFWIGTMAMDLSPGVGALYRADLAANPPEIVRMMTGVTISNGIDWSPDDRRMYYVDTPTGRIDVCDWDAAAGRASRRRPFVAFPRNVGLPDGLCVDADSHVWVALYGGGAVRRYRPDGTLDQEVRLPVSLVTSCAFGGRHLDELFITSGTNGLSQSAQAQEPYAGAIFRCRPGCRGREVNVAHVQIESRPRQGVEPA